MLVAQCPEQFTHAARLNYPIGLRWAGYRGSLRKRMCKAAIGDRRPCSPNISGRTPMCGYVTSQKNRELSV